MASAVDPRFKLKYVAEENRESIEARLTSEMKTVMERASTEPTTTPAADTDVPTGGAQKKKRGLGSFFKATEDTATGPSPPQQDQAIAFELQAYLQARPLDTEADPLEWWKASQTLYPRLSKLARKYLCIPATSAASERIMHFVTQASVQWTLEEQAGLQPCTRLRDLGDEQTALCPSPVVPSLLPRGVWRYCVRTLHQAMGTLYPTEWTAKFHLFILLFAVEVISIMEQ
ncbi:Zinc finger BED domain-containing protein DAYSLEEPER [Merluccius polli]|uniref:Zinc finger BED domain-containing protein DAYSLEEPER n=1 Tax=Merluccius polli TaxID=89951 RepID=A0AA47P074_MERPO|nr:Zinc finger BED domain-containing protein DAYSLEEPER [Merluccius polli]